MLLCSLTTETIHSPTSWCQEQEQVHGLQDLQEHHSTVDGPGEQKKVLLGTRSRSRFPFAQNLLIKPENAHPLLPTHQHTCTHPNQHDLTHSQCTTTSYNQFTTSLRAPWMTSRRRYNPDKKTPLSPLLSQLIQRLYSLHSHLHCLCDHDGRGLPCLSTTESGQGKGKGKVGVNGKGGGALEVYGLSKSLLFGDRIENGSDLNLADDGWVDASGSSGGGGGGGGGNGMLTLNDDGAAELDDGGFDEDDDAEADETLLDWNSDASSTISDREDTDHTMVSLQLERPCASSLNTNVINAGDDFTHTGTAQSATFLNDNSLTPSLAAPIAMWSPSDPDDSATNSYQTATRSHAILPSPIEAELEQASTDMITPSPQSSFQPSTSDSDNDDDALLLPPPTPRPRFIELLDNDMTTGNGMDMDTGLGMIAVDNGADFYSGTDCPDPTPPTSIPVPVLAPASASSSHSFPSLPEVSLNHTINLPPLDYVSTPISSDWRMDQSFQRPQPQHLQLHDDIHSELYEHSASTPAPLPSDEENSLDANPASENFTLFLGHPITTGLGEDKITGWGRTVTADSQDDDGVDLTTRPRTAHGLRPSETSFSLLSPPAKRKDDDDNISGIRCTPANEDEPPEAPRLEVLSDNFDDPGGEEEAEQEGLNLGRELEHDSDAIYLYDPFDLHSDSRRNGRGRGRDNTIPLQLKALHSSPSTSTDTSTSVSPSTSPSTSTSLSLSTPPLTSVSSPTSSLLFPPGLHRPPLRSSSPTSKKHRLKPVTSSYALSEKSQWKLAIAQYQRALSTRGMRHPGFPPSPLGPNWEKYYGRV